jgi:hypothetical protein
VTFEIPTLTETSTTQGLSAEPVHSESRLCSVTSFRKVPGPSLLVRRMGTFVGTPRLSKRRLIVTAEAQLVYGIHVAVPCFRLQGMWQDVQITSEHCCAASHAPSLPTRILPGPHSSKLMARVPFV